MGFADMARKVLRGIAAGKDSSFPQAFQAQSTQPQGGPVSPDRPYLDSEGDLVIPFDSDSRYHWWAGGQSIEETIKEISKGNERV